MIRLLGIPGALPIFRVCLTLPVVGYVQAFNFSSYSVWHIGAFLVLALGVAACLAGSLTLPELTAFIMYNDIVAQQARSVCVQIASVLQNVGSVDKILSCSPPPFPLRNAVSCAEWAAVLPYHC